MKSPEERLEINNKYQAVTQEIIDITNQQAETTKELLKDRNNESVIERIKSLKAKKSELEARGEELQKDLYS